MTYASDNHHLAACYAARGWPVFPTRAKEEADRETGELKPAKTPLTSGGLKVASTKDNMVNGWWKSHPDAMVGLPTGSATGFWVLDLDVKPGVGDGHEWLDDMEREHGVLPDTARATTMNGGTHLLFKHVDGVRNRGGLGECVDVRGDGGYIIAPGSVAADGRLYEWKEGYGPDDIKEAPEWLLELVLPRKALERDPARHNYDYNPQNNDPYVRAALEDELNKLRNAPIGGRGSQVNTSAFCIGQLVGAGALARSEAENGLWAAAQACGIVDKDGEREIERKIKRGLEAGMRDPRVIPEQEFVYDENTPTIDYVRLLENAREKGKKRAAQDVVGAPPVTDDTTADDPPPDSAIRSTVFEWVDPTTLPPREFVYGTHYIRKYVSVTVSPGGLGKTSNSIVEALSMVSGKRLLDIPARKPLTVWLFNAEDPRDEMTRRIMAACLHFKLKPKDLGARLLLDTGREQDLVIAKETKKSKAEIIVPVVDAIVAEIERRGVDVMIIDPFVSTHQVNENDNGAIDRVAKLWAQVADVTGCSIDVVHHLRKVADREATVDDARGAGALIGAARSVRVLNRMSAEQADSAGLPEEERYSYFSIQQGKANMTATSARLQWRKLEDVPLGNFATEANEDGRKTKIKYQDRAGVVTHWDWPSTEEVLSSIPADAKDVFLKRVANFDHRFNDQAQDWAGYALAAAMGEEVDYPCDKGAKRKYKKILNGWLADGTIIVEEVRDSKKGRDFKYVRPGKK